MPQYVDVLNSALTDLADDYTELYFKSQPLFAKFLGSPEGEGSAGGLKKYKLAGNYREFIVVKNGPGTAFNAVTGDEVLPGIRRSVSEKGSEFTARTVYYFNVPIWDLQESGHSGDYGKILNAYPKLALAELKAMVSRQMLSGKSSAGTESAVLGSVGGICTLNGDQTYTPGTGSGSRQGLISFVAPASQTTTVHGLVKQGGASGIPGWYNQYTHTNAFSQDGIKKWRDMVTLCNDQGLTLDGSGVDMVIADPATFSNLLDYHEGFVVMNDGMKASPTTKYMNRPTFMVDGVEWVRDSDIDIADTTAFTTAAARLGVAYTLSTSFFEFFYHGQAADKAGSGFFDMGEGIPLQDMLHYQWRILSNFNFNCRSLRNQGVMTGGSQE